jgi:hypothetical protein
LRERKGQSCDWPFAILSAVFSSVLRSTGIFARILFPVQAGKRLSVFDRHQTIDGTPIS